MEINDPGNGDEFDPRCLYRVKNGTSRSVILYPSRRLGLGRGYGEFGICIERSVGRSPERPRDWTTGLLSYSDFRERGRKNVFLCPVLYAIIVKPIWRDNLNESPEFISDPRK